MSAQRGHLNKGCEVRKEARLAGCGQDTSFFMDRHGKSTYDGNPQFQLKICFARRPSQKNGEVTGAIKSTNAEFDILENRERAAGNASADGPLARTGWTGGEPLGERALEAESRARSLAASGSGIPGTGFFFVGLGRMERGLLGRSDIAAASFKNRGVCRRQSQKYEGRASSLSGANFDW